MEFTTLAPEPRASHRFSAKAGPTPQGLVEDLPNNWQVPAFVTQAWRAKDRDFAVVVPVLNEGARIHRFLTRMNDVEVQKRANVILVDGGSTDGSLDPGKLRALGVAALLRKTAKGRLSAQLRCAYAYALRLGSTGIVTIDGNDKDDPAAIGAFIDALVAGHDFVQASRYVPGGQQENTPKLRDLAIRYVHAPSLAYASGFPWTDTTQGFRAYSRALLTDARVAPFRDVFTDYELLAYLSYRAPRLGFRCTELPTLRRYPRGATPTKISAVRGNLGLIRTLFLACSGAYNPTPAKD